MYSKSSIIRIIYQSLFGILIITWLAPTCTTPSIIVTESQRQGDAAFNEYRYREAIGYYGTMLEASSKLGIYRNFEAEADVYRKLAESWVMLSRFDSAHISIDSAAAIDQRHALPAGVLEDKKIKARIYFYQGKVKEGLQILQKAAVENEDLASSPKNENKNALGEIYLELGNAYGYLGQFPEARESLVNALGLFEKTQNRNAEAITHLALGTMFYDLGDTEQALLHLQYSKRLHREAGYKTTRQDQLIADVLSLESKFQDAMKHQVDALDQARETQIRSHIVWALLGMGDLYKKLGDLEKARDHFKQATEYLAGSGMESGGLEGSLDIRTGKQLEGLKFFQASGSLTGVGAAYLNVGKMYQAEGALAEADEAYRDAQEVYDRLGMDFGRYTALLGRAWLAYEQQNPNKALGLAEKVEAGPFPELHWQQTYLLGRINEDEGNTGEAIRHYRSAVDIIENVRSNISVEDLKVGYLKNKVEVYDRLIRLLMEEGEQEEAFSFSERARARAFLDMLGNRKISPAESSFAELANEEYDQRMQIARLYKILYGGETEQAAEGSRELSKREVFRELENVQQNYNDLLLRIKLNDPEYHAMVSVDPVDVRGLQDMLSQESCILSYWISEEVAYTWLLDREGLHVNEILVSREQLEEEIGDYRRAISGNNNRRVEQLGQTLSNRLIASNSELLKDKNKLIVIPHQSLHFLPFHTLKTPEGKFLIEELRVEYAPSASVLSLCRAKKRPLSSGFLAMALGELELGFFNPLPGTRQEVEKISPLFEEKKVIVEEGFNETAFKSLSSQYALIHLATHGYFDFEQPRYSFVLFADSGKDDGRLTVQEVLNMDLNAELVVLSACQTGLGYMREGDEMTGLSRAFLYAGTPVVLVSLWSVADYPTALLMESFYKNLEEHSFSESLRLAQLEVQKSYPSPYYWAPFVLIGDAGRSLN